MSEYRRIRAEILSGTTERVRAIANNLRREPLTEEELGTLSILIGLEKQIRQEEQKPALRVIVGGGEIGGGDNGKELF